MGVIAAAFAGIIIVFFVYDLLVERRNNNLIVKAAHTNRIVSSLFPSTVRDRLLRDEDVQSRKDGFWHKAGQADYEAKEVTPIADLFPACTVMVSILPFTLVALNCVLIISSCTISFVT